MRSILSRAGQAALSTFAASSALVALDFDGTLAPIVRDREAAAMAERTTALLAAVSLHYPTVVISGRSRGDVERRLGGAPVVEVIGNHGAEPSDHMERFAEAIGEVRRLLAPLLAVPGVEIEDKRYSLAVHYRAANPATARAAVHDRLGGLPPGTRVTAGKSVVNILPAGAPDKGMALLDCWRRRVAGRALFVGDDVTDEDVFALRAPGLVAIRVGRSRASAAPWFLRGQRDIDTLLATLIALREEP